MNKHSTILIVDDDPKIRRMLKVVFEGKSFSIIECETGKDALRLGVTAKPDLMLLDLSLPDMSGLEVLRTLREWSNTPIIVLSACSENKDIIELLDAGADDYLIKPFNFDVLRARINASLRKSLVLEAGDSELCNGSLRIDLVRHEAFLGAELITLTPKEFNLLRFFMGNCGKMLSHRDILREVWGPSQSEETQYLRTFVKQLRDKIEDDPARPLIIVTEAGIGYRMECLNDSALIKKEDLRI